MNRWCSFAGARDRARIVHAAAIVLGGAVFVWVVVLQMAKPIMGWEVLTWDMARDIAARGAAGGMSSFDFPLYAGIMSVFFKLFGANEISARLTGVISYMLMPVVMYALVREIAPPKERSVCGWSAIALLVTSPVIVQGALVIDKADTHIFTLSVMLLYLVIIKALCQGGRRWHVLGVILYAVCLGLKFSTSLAALAAVPLAGVLCGRLRDGFRLTWSILVRGIIVFIAAWTVYSWCSWGMSSWAGPFVFYLQSAVTAGAGGIAAHVHRFALDAARIFLWWSPLFCVPGILAMRYAFREQPRDMKHMLLVAWAITVCAGYLFTNATFSGFPKYVMPALPFFICCAGLYMGKALSGIRSGARGIVAAVVCLLAGILYYALVVGDWLYPLYGLRVSSGGGDSFIILLTMARQAGCMFLLPVVMMAAVPKFIPVSARQLMFLCAGIAIIASGISLNIIQRSAGYSVNFAYGAQGADKVRAFARSTQNMRMYSSVEGFVAAYAGAYSRAIPVRAWSSSGDFIRFIRGARPEYLLVGWGANTAAQMRMLRSGEVSQFLTAYYGPLDMGSYTVFVKKAGAGL